jgi:hypothetical protein
LVGVGLLLVVAAAFSWVAAHSDPGSWISDVALNAWCSVIDALVLGVAVSFATWLAEHRRRTPLRHVIHAGVLEAASKAMDKVLPPPERHEMSLVHFGTVAVWIADASVKRASTGELNRLIRDLIKQEEPLRKALPPGEFAARKAALCASLADACAHAAADAMAAGSDIVEPAVVAALRNAETDLRQIAESGARDPSTYEVFLASAVEHLARAFRELLASADRVESFVDFLRAIRKPIALASTP